MERIKLQIKKVKILIEGGDIRDIYIGGRKDILNHKDVKLFIEERKGRILQIGGKMNYKNFLFDFEIGYHMDPEIGKIWIDKKGKSIGDLNVIQDAYDLIFELYDKFFII